jgi:hypothetical protein
MRKALMALSAGVVAIAVATACGNVTTPAQGTPTPSPTPTGTLTPTPTGSGTATPTGTATPGGTGNLRLDITCSGAGCISGDLRGQVVDCSAYSNVLESNSSLNVTLASGTTYHLWISNVAPGFDCVHTFIDANHDGVKNGSDKSTFLDPQTFVSVMASGTSNDPVMISN